MITLPQIDYSHLLSSNDRTNIKGKNCFDFLRYLFAISLIIAHFCTLTQIDQFWFITGGMRVKAFFVITGFLVSYSFLSRNGDIKSYTKKRIARILPAYFCVIVVGWIVGLCCTNESLGIYLSTKETWNYLLANLCMLNWLQPSLPDVFSTNYMSAVNGSLWSMKFEVIFYIMVPFLFYIIARWNKTIIIILLSIVILATHIIPFPIQLIYFSYFFAGVLGLLLFKSIHQHIWTLLLSSVSIAIILHFIQISWLSQALEPFLFATILLGVAYTFTPLSFMRDIPNVTYGLYLYHFPVIQVLISLGLAQYNIWLCFATTLVITFALANASWFIVEKPIMDKWK